MADKLCAGKILGLDENRKEAIADGYAECGAAANNAGENT